MIRSTLGQGRQSADHHRSDECDPPVRTGYIHTRGGMRSQDKPQRMEKSRKSVMSNKMTRENLDKAPVPASE